MKKHTRKNRKEVKGPAADVTFHGIELWYKHKFEHLGWMLLAKRDGYTDKVMAYKNSTLRLRDTIDRKIRKVHDKDKKADLVIMKNNVELLIEHSDKDF
jgi:predicted ATP-binding protein involved in virulence